MDTLDNIINLINKRSSNKEIASVLKLNQQVITDWKNGKSRSYKKYLPEIAEYFNVSVDYLLGKTDIKNPTANNDDGKNIIKIAGRDGSYIEKHLSDEQIEAFKTMLSSLPDAPDDL